MKIYEDIETERDRIEACIQKYGWTSDHNLDWFMVCANNESGRPVFVEFDDGTGLLTHKYDSEWRIWSDPLCPKEISLNKISEFAESVISGNIKQIWCDDVSENIYNELKKNSNLEPREIYYSLFWPILNMHKYDPNLPGGNFKEMRNGKNKLYREHKVEIVDATHINAIDLHKIVDAWKQKISLREDAGDIYDLKYHKIIDKNFKGFKTARALIIDGKTVGFNAGYEVTNHPGRFAGIIGIHDYSLNDLGTMLWLEDLEWIKLNGYKKLDMQGSDDGGLKLKLRFGAQVERKTDTFSISKM